MLICLMGGKFFFMFMICCELEMMSLPTQRPKATKACVSAALANTPGCQLILEKQTPLTLFTESLKGFLMLFSVSPDSTISSFSDFICMVNDFSILFQHRVSPRMTAASLCKEQNGTSIQGLIFFLLIVLLFKIFSRSDTAHSL